MLGQIYQWAWFRLEFWLTPVNRRPLTFIMKDWLFNHVALFIVLFVVWFGGVFAWNLYHPVPASIVGFLSAFLLAHLVWGEKWLFGQQEDPQYLGD